MISIVSVFNDADVLRERLASSVQRQQGTHEFIPVDNRAGIFRGAAEALNSGARSATGDWVAFVHQDIELLRTDWLVRAESHLTLLQSVGWSGVVGRTADGKWCGHLRDRAAGHGDPLSEPRPVQTLDEIVLICRRVADHRYFDEHVPGWHAYGVDACCTALRAGRMNYVLPLPVWHDSQSTNQSGIRDAHAYVWQKHRHDFRRIYTTIGTLPHPYGWSGSYKISTAERAVRGLRYASWMLYARSGFADSPWAVLEALTASETHVDCLHREMALEPMLTTAFTDRTHQPRQITHRYEGLVPAPADGCVVIAPDLAATVRQLGLAQRFRKLLVCVKLDMDTASPAEWRRILRRPFICHLAIEPDETRWAILEMSNSVRASR